MSYSFPTWRGASPCFRAVPGLPQTRGRRWVSFPSWNQPQGWCTSSHSLTNYVLSIVHPEAWYIQICYPMYSRCCTVLLLLKKLRFGTEDTSVKKMDKKTGPRCDVGGTHAKLRHQSEHWPVLLPITNKPPESWCHRWGDDTDGHLGGAAELTLGWLWCQNQRDKPHRPAFPWSRGDF